MDTCNEDKDYCAYCAREFTDGNPAERFDDANFHGRCLNLVRIHSIPRERFINKKWRGDHEHLS